MRRLATAMLLLSAAAFGCGRTGPNGKVGSATFIVEMPPAGAGAIDLTIGDSIAGSCPGDCGPFRFQPGATVTLTAVDDDGDFATWAGDAPCGTDRDCIYVADGDQLVSAIFNATVTVAVTTSAGSIVSIPPGIDCPAAACTGSFAYESTVELAPGGDEILTSWGGDCATDEDRRCQLQMGTDKSATAAFGSLRVDLFGTVADEFAEAIAADPLVPGGYVVAGSHYAPMPLGDALLSYTLGQDLFVARFDRDGVVTWHEEAGGAGDVRPHALVVGAEGAELACYVGGSFTGAVIPSGSTMPVDPQGTINGFLAKFRSDASTALWWRSFAGQGADNVSVVTDLDLFGTTIAMAGVQAGNVTLPGSTAINLGANQAGGRKHALSALWDADGDVQLAVHHGKNNNAHGEANAVVMDANGVFFAGGREDISNDTAGLAGPCTDATNPNNVDAWLFSMTADFTACGAANLNAPLRGADIDHYSSLAPGNGDYLLTGFTRTGASQGPTISAIDATGAASWTQDWPATGGSGAWTGAWDAVHGEWVVAGSFGGTISVDSTDYVSSGGLDVLVVWLDAATGDPLAAVQLDGTGDDVVGGPVLPGTALGGTMHHGYAASAITIEPNGTVAITGYTRSPTLAGTPNASAGGTSDLFIAHLLRAP